MPDLTLSLPTDSLALQPEPKIDYAPRQLLTPLPEPGHFLLVIDNSSLEVFTTCPKSADYKLVRRREAHARNAALTFGGAIHEGLEKFLTWQYSEQKAQDPFDMDEVFPNCGTMAQDNSIVSFFTNHPTPPDEYRTVTNALAVLAAYRQRAALPDYTWDIQSDANGPLIERAFELPLGVIEVNDYVIGDFVGDPPNVAGQQLRWQGRGCETYVSHIHIAWSGRIDAVAKCGNPLGNRVCDHKTGKVDPQEYPLSWPVIGYVWAGQQLWPELNISGFCLNALSTKKPTAGCSMTDTGPRGGKPALEMFRSYFEYTPERLAQWQNDTLLIVSDFINCLVRGQFPRHSKWCFGKYGRCQYFDVCCQDNPAVRLAMLNSDMFRNVTWNPVAGR